jgi:hypothetical protein
MSDDAELRRVDFFSIQLDESTDICDVFQSLAFIRIVFNDGNIKERLKTVPLHWRTGGEDILLGF